MKLGHARAFVGHLTRQRSTSLTCDQCTSRCPPSRSPRRCPHHSVTASETSRASGPNPAPDADSDKDSAELRALHSDYIEDMARNYANDFSDTSSEEDEAVRTHGLSSSEERESVCLHNEDLPQRQRISDNNTMFHAQVHTSASPTGAVPILFKSYHSPYRLKMNAASCQWARQAKRSTCPTRPRLPFASRGNSARQVRGELRSN